MLMHSNTAPQRQRCLLVSLDAIEAQEQKRQQGAGEPTGQCLQSKTVWQPVRRGRQTAGHVFGTAATMVESSRGAWSRIEAARLCTPSLLRWCGSACGELSPAWRARVPHFVRRLRGAPPPLPNQTGPWPGLPAGPPAAALPRPRQRGQRTAQQGNLGVGSRQQAADSPLASSRSGAWQDQAVAAA